MTSDVIGSSRFLVKTAREIGGAEALELQRRLQAWIEGRDPSPLILGYGAHAFEYEADPPRWRHVCCTVDPRRVKDG